MSPFLLAAYVVLALLVLDAALRATRAYRRWQGQRLVRCPETRDYAVVEIDAAQAARKALLGQPYLRLHECSRWGERGPCAQPCLNQIVETADGCLVRSYVKAFYEGRSCALCHKPFVDVGWTEPLPAALRADGTTVGWDAVPVERLPSFLAETQPVCRECHLGFTAA